MDHSAFPQAFHAQLAGRLRADDVQTVSTALLEAGVSGQVWELVVELQERSAKLSREAIDALPEMVERCEPEIMVTWMDVARDVSREIGGNDLEIPEGEPASVGGA